MKITKNAYDISGLTILQIPKNEINYIDFATCAEPRQTLSSYYANCDVKPDILCNGGLFVMSTGKPILNYKDNGTVYSKVTTKCTDGFGIVNGMIEYGMYNNSNFQDFISGYPVLVKNGEITDTDVASDINYKARRTAIGYDLSNIYLVIVEGSGMYFNELQDIFIKLKVTYAINLDGGGSTKLLQNGKDITSTLYNRAVDNVVGIYLKQSTDSKTTETKIIYRVQIGAFSKQSNAEAYCQKIKNISDDKNIGYKNAYVRKVGNLYKVQVGAYSVKANAQKVLNDLKIKGYSAFITT